MKRWTVLRSREEAANKLAEAEGLGRLGSAVMAARGYGDAASLGEFLNPGELLDPFLLPDMQKAADIINQAIDNGEVICVYGDYDCDGVTASAIVYDYLLNMGGRVLCYIPERSEGYGLNRRAIEEIHESEASLIVTVDNGISAHEEAEYIYELGMRLVITDHHQPSDRLPVAEAVVNPHLESSRSEFKELCGAGVALKLLAALEGGSYDMVFEQYGDIVAIGTIADIVPLVGENRAIVKKGLSLLKDTENCGLISLMEESGVDPSSVTSETAAFSITPRINAAGRFGSAMTALDMLTCEQEEAGELSRELCRLNEKRKEAENKITGEILSRLESEPSLARKRVLVISGEGWHHGVIGIAAAKVMELCEKPVIILSSDSDGLYRGSARSFGGFNIFDCFSYCSGILLKWGGHEKAGGLTVRGEDLERLDEMIQEYAGLRHPVMPKYTLSADRLIRGSELTPENIDGLERLEPFGEGNPVPLFAFYGARIASVAPLKSGAHTRLELEYDGARLSALLFRVKTAELALVPGDLIDLMGRLQAKSYMGRRSVSVIVSDYRLHGIKQEDYLSSYDTYESYIRNEDCEPSALRDGLPDRSELIEIYKTVAAASCPIGRELIYGRLIGKGISSFKLSVALDSFRELGLIRESGFGSGSKIELVKTDKKVDIMSAPAISGLRKRISSLEAKGANTNSGGWGNG